MRLVARVFVALYDIRDIRFEVGIHVFVALHSIKVIGLKIDDLCIRSLAWLKSFQ